MKKYELRETESVQINGKPCYMIVALTDFGDIHAGMTGGYVSGEHNLSQEGDCWIRNCAVVTDDCIVSGDAQVRDHARLTGHVVVDDHAVIGGNVNLAGYMKIYGNAVIKDDVTGLGNKKGHMLLRVHDNAQITESSFIGDCADIGGNCVLSGHAAIYEDARVSGDLHFSGKVKVYGDVSLGGTDSYDGDIQISSTGIDRGVATLSLCSVF